MEARLPLVDKYRPKKLDDLIGQDVAVRILKNSFKDKNWHHAYILEGEKGTGKTTTGRIMAAMENCKNAPTLEPCGVCERCLEIFESRSVDVREMDAASNRSIDDIRALQETVSYNPIFCNTKYYIIDEAHDLTAQATEASLKMIEEPPSFVRFILCTTQPEAFKETIPSRCIILNFKKIDWMELYQYLCKIAQLEGIKYEDEALKIVAKSAEGSARNALRNLQTVYSYSGDEIITPDAARNSLGSISSDSYFELINHLVELNAPEAIKCVNKIMVSCGNAGKIFDGLLEHLRNLQMYLIGGSEVISEWLGDDEIKKIKLQVSKLKKPNLIHLMFREAINQKKSLAINVNPQGLLIDFVVVGMMEVVKSASKEKTLLKNNQ